MKYVRYILILLALSACRTKSVAVIERVDETTWTKVDFKPSKDLVFPNNYGNYILNGERFKEQLQLGEIELPALDGSIHNYKVKDSGTMSPELQAKFPEIKSYAGYDIANNLCQCRVDQKGDLFKIVILCNNKTIYIQDLHDLGRYFIYDKKDLPEGFGTIKK